MLFMSLLLSTAMTVATGEVWDGSAQIVSPHDQQMRRNTSAFFCVFCDGLVMLLPFVLCFPTHVSMVPTPSCWRGARMPRW